MKLGMTRLQNLKKLYNVDNTTNKEGHITHYILLNVLTHGQTKKMTFLVADIGREDLILGYPWLAAYEPQFNWKNRTLNGKYHPVILSSTYEEKREAVIRALLVDEKAKIVQTLEEQCYGQSIATDLA